MNNEIKATAATWEDIKRLSEENERLKRSNAQLVEKLELAESFMSDSEWVSYLVELENKTNE